MRRRRKILLAGLGALLIVAALGVRTAILDQRLRQNDYLVQLLLVELDSEQRERRRRCFIDADKDGIGEYADLQQLQSIYAETLLAGSQGTSIPNVMEYHGYLVRIDVPPGIDDREARWSCYAWPMEQGNASRRTYFISEDGDLLKNSRASYWGVERMPPPDGARIMQGSPGRLLTAVNSKGSDGFRWLVWNPDLRQSVLR